METIVVTPEKEQKTLWFLGWAVTFALGLALWVILMFFADKLIFGLFTVGWVMLSLPFLFWIPAYHRSLEYGLEADAVKARKGVFWRRRITVPYPKITNVDVTQGPVQRLFNIGTIHVQTAGAGGAQGGQAELRLVGIRDMEGLKETIMERVRAYTISGPEEVKKEIVRESDSEIMKHMLKELTAIREALEKRKI